MRRPDVVLFVNGFPLGGIELKNAADENATADAAISPLETYQVKVTALFDTNIGTRRISSIMEKIGPQKHTIARAGDLGVTSRRSRRAFSCLFDDCSIA